MEKKSVIWWITFILLSIWQLPQTIIGLLMLPFMKNKKLVADRHFNLCWESESMSGGISLGPFAYVSELSSYEESISHEEDGHTVQSKILGPLYLLVVGLPSIIWAMSYDYKKQCYYSFYTESWANKCAGLEVDENCRLKFKS